jgi:hypothetical protein
LVGKPEGKKHFRRNNIDGRMILKLILNKEILLGLGSSDAFI